MGWQCQRHHDVTSYTLYFVQQACTTVLPPTHVGTCPGLRLPWQARPRAVVDRAMVMTALVWAVAVVGLALVPHASAFGPCRGNTCPPNFLFILADDWGWGDLVRAACCVLRAGCCVARLEFDSRRWPWCTCLFKTQPGVNAPGVCSPCSHPGCLHTRMH